MIRNIFLSAGVLSVALLSSCGKKGASIGAPEVKPPVQSVTPPGLLSSVLGAQVSRLEHSSISSCTETGTIYSRVKCRLFYTGPTEILQILAAIDSRMADIDSRAQESEHGCLNAAPVDLTSDFSFPGGETFPHYLQCHDTFGSSGNGSGGVGFGQKDGVWYLREYSTSRDSLGGSNFKGIGKVVKVSPDSSVEGWVILGLSKYNPPDESTALIHFKTNKPLGTIEMTVGGQNIGFQTVHFKSNPSYLYVAEGSTAHCLDATTYVDTGNISLCASLSSSLELSTLGLSAGSGGSTTANNVDLSVLYDMGRKGISGVSAF
jgi:hypothetical protein